MSFSVSRILPRSLQLFQELSQFIRLILYSSVFEIFIVRFLAASIVGRVFLSCFILSGFDVITLMSSAYSWLMVICYVMVMHEETIILDESSESENGVILVVNCTLSSRTVTFCFSRFQSSLPLR